MDLPFGLEFATVDQSGLAVGVQDAFSRLGIDVASQLRTLVIREGSTIVNVNFTHGGSVTLLEAAIENGVFYVRYQNANLHVLWAPTEAPSNAPSYSTIAPRTTTAATVDGSKKKNDGDDDAFATGLAVTAVGLAIGGLVLGLIILLAVWWYLKKKRSEQLKLVTSPGLPLGHISLAKLMATPADKKAAERAAGMSNPKYSAHYYPDNQVPAASVTAF